MPSVDEMLGPGSLACLSGSVYRRRRRRPLGAFDACRRRDVPKAHLRYRAHGEGDRDEA
jgi:hypothetical protein